MIPVALPTYNRPHYLNQTLEWLEANERASEIILVTSEEPNKECQELITNCTLQKDRTINSKRLGLCANVCQAISKAAEKADWFVVVEDDVLIGYDAITMAEWAIQQGCDIVNFEQPKSARNSFFEEIKHDNWFHCHGWAAKSHVWKEFMEHFDPLKSPYQSWANPFNYFLKNHYFEEPVIATPVMSRSYYIGKHGEFSTPNKYQRHVPEDWIRMRKPPKYVFNENHELTSAPSKSYLLNECKAYYDRSRRI